MLKGVIVAFGPPCARSAYPVALVANGTKSLATMIAPEKLSSFSSARYASMATTADVEEVWFGPVPEVTQLAVKVSAARTAVNLFNGTPSDARGVPPRPRATFR